MARGHLEQLWVARNSQTAREGKKSVNTKFSYIYRDGGNNKRSGAVIFAGPPSPELERRLQVAFDEGKYFIAQQIGVPEIFLWNSQMNYDPDDPTTYPKNIGRDGYCISEDMDHCWHEFRGIEVTTERPDDPRERTIDEFVQEVERIALEGWIDSTPQKIKGSPPSAPPLS